MEVIWKLENPLAVSSVATYGQSVFGNYLYHLVWTYSIWVWSPSRNSWKWVIWVMEMRSRWQSSSKINRAWCIFPTSTWRQMWFNTVIGFTFSSWISVDKYCNNTLERVCKLACKNSLFHHSNYHLFKFISYLLAFE